MILKIIRWVSGYIVFKIESSKSGIFLNLASKSQMHMWDINKINEILFAKISFGEYDILSNLLKKRGISVQIVQKIGLPFFYSRNKNRKGFIIGLIFYFVIIHFLSFFVWKINVIGNDRIDSKAVEQFCKEDGIFVGALKKNIKCKIAGQNIMAKIPSISWISINLDGCVANICIEEQIDKPSIDSEGETGNIISECDAQIVRMETFSGTPMVKSGDIVFKNQILVGSFEKGRNGEMTDVNARAKIWAKVSEEISEFEPFKKVSNLRTGRKKKLIKLDLFGKIININFWTSPEENWETEMSKSELNFFGFPFGFITERFYETKDVEVFRTKDELTEICKKKIYENIKSRNLDLIKSHETQTENEKGILFKINFEYLKNIAVYDKNRK